MIVFYTEPVSPCMPVLKNSPLLSSIIRSYIPLFCNFSIPLCFAYVNTSTSFEIITFLFKIHLLLFIHMILYRYKGIFTRPHAPHASNFQNEEQFQMKATIFKNSAYTTDRESGWWSFLRAAPCGANGVPIRNSGAPYPDPLEP